MNLTGVTSEDYERVYSYCLPYLRRPMKTKEVQLTYETCWKKSGLNFTTGYTSAGEKSAALGQVVNLGIAGALVSVAFLAL